MNNDELTYDFFWKSDNPQLSRGWTRCSTPGDNGAQAAGCSQDALECILADGDYDCIGNARWIVVSRSRLRGNYRVDEFRMTVVTEPTRTVERA